MLNFDKIKDRWGLHLIVSGLWCQVERGHVYIAEEHTEFQFEIELCDVERATLLLL